MGHKKIYPRVKTRHGTTLLTLLEPTIFERLYADYPECRTTSDELVVSAYLKCYSVEPDAQVMFKNACEVMREWMQIESKLPVLILTTSDGILFALSETREAVTKYRWLHSKAQKYAKRVMAYIRNVYGK
jgi:hypothetical protein